LHRYGFDGGVQQRCDSRLQAKLARCPERVGGLERRAWDRRALALLDHPNDNFDAPALELPQSIFDHGTFCAAPGQFGVLEANAPLSGLTLGGLRL
jgi:hypothetical protein